MSDTKQPLRKGEFCIENLPRVKGYTDGSLWNGWSNVWLTKEEIVKFFSSESTSVQFDEQGNLHLKLEYMGEPEFYTVEQVNTVDGVLPLFYFNGWTFDEAEGDPNKEDWQPAEVVDGITMGLGLEWDTDDNIEAVLNYIREHCDKDHFAQWIREIAEAEAAVIDGSDTDAFDDDDDDDDL